MWVVTPAALKEVEVPISMRAGFCVSAAGAEGSAVAINNPPVGCIEKLSTLVSSEGTVCSCAATILGSAGRALSLAFEFSNGEIPLTWDVIGVVVNIELVGKGGGVNSVLAGEKKSGILGRLFKDSADVAGLFAHVDANDFENMTSVGVMGDVGPSEVGAKGKSFDRIFIGAMSKIWFGNDSVTDEPLSLR